MATGYGSWIGGDDWRAIVDCTVTNTNATTCKVTVTGKVQSVYATASYFTASITNASNGGTGSYSGFTVSPGVTTTIGSPSFSVSRSDSAKNMTVKCAVYGSGDYSGYTSTASVTVTIPAIQYSVPNDPSALTATYVSDSSATLAWTNGSTTSTKPRTATLIERSTDGGSWVQIASAASSAANYTDNGIEANHSYDYRICATNSAGNSAYATSSTIYTTPAAPTSIPLEKVAATTIQVDAEADAPYATGYDVERTYDGGSTWASVATNTALPINDTVSGGEVQYRVRSVRSALASAWTLSASIVTITPPLAPTITAQPANPTEYGDSVTISWTPNHPDGSAQAGAQVAITSPGGTTTTNTINDSTATYTFTPNATGAWTAQVRTLGLDPSYGAWSATISWGVYNPPSVAITSPATDGTTITTLPLSVTWTVTDSTGVSAQRVIVANYNKTQATATRSLSLTAADVSLDNGGSYSIAVRVMGGSGLITEATRTFDVSWTPPADPTATITEGDGGSASIQVAFGTGGAATSSIDLFRVNDDGTEWTIATGMADGDTAIDPLPPLGVQVTYRAIATAASGSTASASFSQIFGGTDWVLNFGSSASESLSFAYNPQASYSLDHGGTAYHFADGGAGNGLPVWYGTTDRDESGSLSFDNVMNANTDRLRDLCTAYPVAWLRDPFGHRWRAHVRPTTGHGIGRVWAAGIDWDAVRFREAW